MQQNRRGILGLFAGAAIGGKAVAEQAIQGGLGGPPALPQGWGNVGQAAGSQCIPQAPLMDHSSALRFIFGDSEALAEIRAELAAGELRSNPYIDPDIQIKKSWSPMAKITFQRQRNIERAMAEVVDGGPDRPNRFVYAIEKRLKKLMWGA